MGANCFSTNVFLSTSLLTFSLVLTLGLKKQFYHLMDVLLYYPLGLPTVLNIFKYSEIILIC